MIHVPSMHVKKLQKNIIWFPRVCLSECDRSQSKGLIWMTLGLVHLIFSSQILLKGLFIFLRVPMKF
jgi:hypothetical protein